MRRLIGGAPSATRCSIHSCDDGIEYSACISEPTPEELLERKEKYCRRVYLIEYSDPIRTLRMVRVKEFVEKKNVKLLISD
jgi:hypothetical protein